MNSSARPGALTYLVTTLSIAAAYAVAALLGNELTFAPAYASPIWPAAGIALAAVLVLGVRYWPGVWLGYAGFSLLTYLAGREPVGEPWLVLGMATITAMQAVIGAWLAKSPLRRTLAGNERCIFVGLLVAGPIACVIAPTAGGLLLLQLGMLESSNYAANWLVWWSGDSIGVLLFGPLALAIVPKFRQLLQGRVLQTVLPLLATAALLVSAVTWYHHAERSEVLKPLAVQAEHEFGLAHEAMIAAAREVVVTGNYFASSEQVSAAEFETFTRRIRSEGLRAIEWLPRVSADARAQFEATAMPTGGGAIRILELAADGGLRVASSRPEYFPVLYVEPLATNRAAVGYDIGSNEIRRAALERARDNGAPVATGPVRLVQQPGKSAVLLAVPVYEGTSDPETLTVSERRRLLTGFVLGVLEPETLAASAASDNASSTSRFELTDVTPGARPRAIFNLGGEFEGSDAATRLTVRDFEFFGRQWRLQAFTSDGFWTAGASGKARLLLVTLLLSALLISSYVISSSARNRTITHRIEERTRELDDSRRRLGMAMDIAGIVSWSYDPGRQVFHMNDRYYQWLLTDAATEGGYQVSAADWVQRFLHPDDRQTVTKALGSMDGLPRQQLRGSLRFRVIRRDGAVRHAISRFDLETDARNNDGHLVGTIQDDTARQEAELARLESEEYSRKMLESSRDCIKILDIEGRLLDMNANGAELMCVPNVCDIVGEYWPSFWRREEDVIVVEQALDVARDGGAQRFRGRTPTMDGTWKWWDVDVSPIRDAYGKAVRLLAVSRDITAEYEASEELKRLNAGLEAEVERRTRALTESEQQFRATFDVAAVGIAHVAPDGRILRVNPKLCDIIGYSEEQILGASEFDAGRNDNEAQYRALVDQLLSGEIRTYTHETRFTHRNGSEVWVRVTGSAVRDESGAVQYRVAIVEDVSAQRAEQAARVASEQRYRELFKRNPMPMWTYDVDTLRFTSVNDAAVFQYGYTRNEFLEMTLLDIRPAEHRAGFQDSMRDAPTGFAPAHDIVHRRKDGSQLIAEITAHDVIDEGRCARLVLAADITERRHAEAMLAGNRRILERVAGGAPLTESLDSLCELVETEAPDVSCTVLLRDPRSGTLKHASARGLPSSLVASVDSGDGHGDDSFFAIAAKSDEPLYVSDIGQDSRWAAWQRAANEHGLLACWTQPVMDEGDNVIGCVVSYLGESRLPGDDEQQAVLRFLDTASVAISRDRAVSALQQQEEMNRLLLENLSEGVVACDADGNLALFNRTAREWHGADLRELPPEEWAQHYDLYESDGRTPLSLERIPLMRALQGERVLNAGMSIVRKGDVPRYIVASGGPLLDASGTKIGATVVMHDITESHRNEKQFHDLFESASDAIVLADDKGRIKKVNRRTEKLFGWKRDLLVGKGLDSLLPSAHLHDLNLRRRTPTGTDELPALGRPNLVGRRHDGSELLVDVSLSPMETDDGVMVAVSIRDVTERIESENAMRDALTTLDATSDAAFIWDPESESFSYVNDGATQHLGYSREELLGMSLADINPTLDTSNMQAFLASMKQNTEQGPFQFTSEHRHRDGHLIPVEGNLQYVCPPGSKPRFIAIVRDITERQRAMERLRQAAEDLKVANETVEKERASLARRVEARTAELQRINDELAEARDAAEAALRAKSTFLAVMSHEIRTPMNGILGMADVLAHGDLAEDQEDIVTTIRKSSLSLLGLIDGILDFSKIEAGRMELERAPVDLPVVAESVCDALSASALAASVDLSLFIDPSLPADIYSDATRLRQVLYNLVGNAIKFSAGRGDVRGRVTLHLEQDDNGHLLLQVSDNGIGIAEDVLPKLFRTFTQGEVSTTRKFGGTGLGLAITRRIVEMMDGQIDVTSTEGEGATFTVTLPVDAAGDKPAVDLAAVAGLHCCLLDPTGSTFDPALPDYLARAGIRVSEASEAAEVRDSAGDGSTILLRYEDSGHDAATGNNMRQIVLLRGAGRRARVTSGRTVSLDGGVLRCRDLLNAMAIAAGRASPDSEDDISDTAVRRALHAPTVAEARARGGLILVAEDDPVNQKVILRQLTMLGYAGDIASNGREALEMWQSGRYALVLTDLHMPEMDGYELVARIREGEGEGNASRVPILALTANALHGEAERALAAGVDIYLTKPIQLAGLQAAIRQSLGDEADINDQPGQTGDGAAAMPAATAPVVDLPALAQMVGNDPAVVNELLSEYRASSAALRMDLHGAAAVCSAESVGELAHKHKGAARAIGATALGDICAELENAGRAGDIAAVPGLLAEYDRAIAEVDEFIIRHLADKAPMIDDDRPAQEAAAATG